MKRLVWDARALADLESISEYIAADSKKAAARVVSYIRERALVLEAMPKLGMASSDPGTRELILPRFPYVLVYEIAGDEVRILAVFHQQQNRR
ncbi:MAG: type II toxin-antitoxin system RelE/ParE family toxin [Terricaulis sp.]